MKFVITRTGTGFRTETTDPQLAARFRKNPAFRVAAAPIEVANDSLAPEEFVLDAYPVKTGRQAKRQRSR